MREPQKQPQGLFLIAFTQAWESFSFYGMRVLLVLYLIHELHYSDKSAFALYALYIALVEMAAGIGGFVADRFLGYRLSVLLGGGAIACGHLLLTISGSTACFFLGLGFIVVGSTLFRTNLHALVGLLYKKEDPARDQGFTLLYTAINMGGFSASLLCGLIAHLYGWHLGFGLAAFGMLIGIIPFALKTHLFEEHESPHKKPILLPSLLLALSALAASLLLSSSAIVLPLALPLTLFSFLLLAHLATKDLPTPLRLQLLSLLTLLILYFSAMELMGSLLTLYAETAIDRTLFGLTIPTPILSAINPLIVILLGPLLARLTIPLHLRLSASFLLLSLAFFLLTHATLAHLLIAFSAIALGELCLAPLVFSICSKAAPPHKAGLMMGLVTLAFSLGSLLSGQISTLTLPLTQLLPLLSLTALLIALPLLYIPRPQTTLLPP